MHSLHLSSRQVHSNHLTGLCHRKSLAQKHDLTVPDLQPDLAHRPAYPHEEPYGLSLPAPADMLRYTGTDSITGVDCYIIALYRHLPLRCKGCIFSGNASLIRNEIHQIMHMDHVAGSKDSRNARFTMLVYNRPTGERMELQPKLP